jgi:hypothetical protein
LAAKKPNAPGGGPPEARLFKGIGYLTMILPFIPSSMLLGLT